MDRERIEQLIENKIVCLRKAIENTQNAIPAFRYNACVELDNLCFEIIELLGNTIISLQSFNHDVQMDSLERAKGIEQALKKYVLFEIKAPAIVQKKKSKLFISHSTIDSNYVSELVKLFEYLGFGKDTMFCSSYPGYGIPLDEDIYEYLKKQFNDYELYIILVLSDNYYHSPASLNEMGAAWVLSAKQSAVLLPGFDFKEIKGAVNPNRISIKMDQEDLIDLKYKLGQLREKLVSKFELDNYNAEQWERKRDEFIDSINSIRITKKNKKSR